MYSRLSDIFKEEDITKGKLSKNQTILLKYLESKKKIKFSLYTIT